MNRDDYYSELNGEQDGEKDNLITVSSGEYGEKYEQRCLLQVSGDGVAVAATVYLNDTMVQDLINMLTEYLKLPKL